MLLLVLALVLSTKVGFYSSATTNIEVCFCAFAL
jgi:hypothetical protein